MKKWMILLLLIVYLLPSVPVLASDTSTLIDTIENFSMMYRHSDGLQTINSYGSQLGDYVRIRAQKAEQYVIYKTEGEIQQFEISAYCAGSAASDVRFFTSADEQNWEEIQIVSNLTDWEKAGTKGIACTGMDFWINRSDYSGVRFVSSQFPDGKYYLKIVFPETPAIFELSKVQIYFTKAQKESIEEEGDAQRKEDQTVLNRLAAIGILESTEISEYMTIEQLETIVTNISGQQANLQDYGVPGDRVRGRTMAQVILPLLGYSFLQDAEAYYQQAVKLGLFDYSDAIFFDYIDAVQFLDEALQTQCMELHIENGKPVYQLSGETMLEKLMGVYTVSGLVTQNQYTSLYSTQTTPPQCIRIDETVYETAFEGASAFLGYSVRGYYREEDTSYVLLYLEKKQNQRVYVSAAKIENADGGKIQVENGVRSKNLRLAASPDLIYNGVWKAFDEALLTPEFGSVELIDHNKDGRYETLLVHDYEPAIVLAGFKDSDRILFRFRKNGSEEMYLNESETYRILKNGTEVSLDVLAEQDVVGIAENGSFLEIEVFSDTISGTVDSYSAETMVIDGVEYELGNEWKYFLENECFSQPELGIYGLFRMTEGRILSFAPQNVQTYGYVRKTYLNEEENCTYMRVLHGNGKWKTYRCAEKVKLNRKSVQSSELYAALEQLGLLSGLIRFSINKNEQINKIETYQEANDLSGYDRDKRAARLSNGALYRTTNLTSTQYSFAGYFTSGENENVIRVLIGKETPIFCVPESEEDRKDERKYRVYFGTCVNQFWLKNLDAYNQNDFDVAEACCGVMPKDSTVLEHVTLCGVEKIEVLEAGTEKITVNNNGTKAVWTTTDNTKYAIATKNNLSQLKTGENNVYQDFGFEDLEIGDVCHAYMAQDGTVEKIIIYAKRSDTERGNYICYNVGEDGFTSGKITGIDRNRFYLKIQTVAEKELVYTMQWNAPVIVIERESVSAGTLEDIEIGDRVMTCQSWHNITFIIVYKG